MKVDVLLGEEVPRKSISIFYALIPTRILSAHTTFRF